MKKFLIQTINGEIVHDFTFTLIETIKFYNWYHINDQIYYEKCEIEDINEKYHDFCPVGSVEFVHFFYKKIHNIDNIKPINVPNELASYFFSGRLIKNYHINDINGEDLLIDFKNEHDSKTTYDFFIKSNDEVKYEKNGFYKSNEIANLSGNSFQISNIIDIDSEYRCFVFKNNLVGLRFYSGDFTKFPSINKIKMMIDSYKESAPIAYTLDVGIAYGECTIVIECHNFYSCGLYGFNDIQLPLMHWLWHINFLEKNIKHENNSN